MYKVKCWTKTVYGWTSDTERCATAEEAAEVARWQMELIGRDVIERDVTISVWKEGEDD